MNLNLKSQLSRDPEWRLLGVGAVLVLLAALIVGAVVWQARWVGKGGDLQPAIPAEAVGADGSSVQLLVEPVQGEGGEGGRLESTVQGHAPSADHVAVRVLSDGKVAVGVPVAIAPLGEGERGGLVLPLSPAFQTDEDGIARIPLKYTSRAKDAQLALAAEVLGVFAERALSPLGSAGGAGDGVIEIQMPSYGVLEFERGSCPYRLGYREAREQVCLWAAGTEDPGASAVATYRLSRVGISDGLWTFPVVEANLAVQARIISNGVLLAPQGAVGPPPGTARRASLDCDSLGLVVDFDIDGHPFRPNGKLYIYEQVGVDPSPRLIAEYMMESDGDSSCLALGRQLQSDFNGHVFVRVDSREGVLESGVTPLVKIESDRSILLGRLSLSRLQELSSGVVVGAGGAPVPGVEIRLGVVGVNRNEGPVYTRRGVPAMGRVVTTDDSGEFVLCGVGPFGELWVSARKRGYCAVVREVALGEEIEIVMEQAAGVGIELLNCGVSPERISATLVSAGGMPLDHVRARSGCRLHLESAYEGLASVTIEAGQGAEYVVEGISVVAGEVLDLGQLDLSDVFVVTDFIVTDHRGGAVPMFRVVEAESGEELGIAMGGAQLRIFSAQRLGAVQVHAPGYVTSDVNTPSSENRVSLGSAAKR